VILTLIFYQCRGSCVLELEGALKCFKGLKTMSVGKDFDVLTVSIHPKETPDLAAAKKQLALSLYGRPGAESGWHFLVGDMLNIQSLTRTVGFRYTYDPATDAIAHPTGILVLTPQGRVSRYFFGVNYASSMVRQAVLDAATNKIGAKAEPILMGCLQYDPKTGKYRVVIERVLQVAGLLTVLILGTYVGGMLYYERRARHRAVSVEP
jgi:protein SCO1/2